MEILRRACPCFYFGGNSDNPESDEPNLMERNLHEVSSIPEAASLASGSLMNSCDLVLQEHANQEKIKENANVKFDSCIHKDKYKHQICGQFQVGQFGKPFSAGRFGQVYRTKDQSDREFAIKVISADYKSSSYLEKWRFDSLRELFFSYKLRHSNILKFYDHIWLGQKDKPTYLAIKCELLDYNLYAVLSKMQVGFNVAQLKCLIVQIGSALDHMHTRNIAHHDVKPLNIVIRFEIANLLDMENLHLLPDQLLRCLYKLIDYGMARRYLYSRELAMIPNHRHGTVKYFSPEKANPNVLYSPYSADCFAFGVTLEMAMMGLYDFDRSHTSDDDDDDEDVEIEKNKAKPTMLELCNKYLASIYGVEGPHEVVRSLLLPEAERIQVDLAIRMANFEV